MKTVYLVGCSQRKTSTANAAEDLYQGVLFKKQKDWLLQHDKDWGILSALHGFLEPKDVIEPYDVALNGLSKEGRRAWANRTNQQLRSRLPQTHFVCFAGALYAVALEGLLFSRPLRGLAIGKQLQMFSQGGPRP